MNLDPAVIIRELKKMKDPQDVYPSILVGGTNGKGSVCAMTSSILISAGYRVGLYTSPHLVDVRERIRYNGRMIATQEMADCVTEVRATVADALTYFEFLTAVAFLFFCRQKVDIAVLEVGMGGRLDATNVVRPVVSVISNVSIEHSDYLGTRLSQIAREKGGIIHEGGVCLTAASQKPVLDVLEGICRERKADLYRIGRDIRVNRDRRGASFTYDGMGRRFRHLPCPLRGRHQIKNAALAVGIMEILSRQSWAIPEEAIRSGLEGTRWEGRLEILQEDPQVVIDGAHNPAGVSALCQALKSDFIYRRLIIVFGVLRDKDYAIMIRKVAAIADILILTRPAVERALPPQALADIARQFCPDVLIREDLRQAFSEALSLADPEDLICVAGSLYLVGQLKASLEH